jgi:hypothetical protein
MDAVSSSLAMAGCDGARRIRPKMHRHASRIAALPAVALAALLAGCGGQTTVSSSSIGTSQGGGPPKTRYEFTVNGSTVAVSQTQILIQTGNTVNNLIHFKLVNVQLDANGQPLPESAGSPYFKKGADVYFDSDHPDATNAPAVGTFDTKTFTYTPPAQIHKDPLGPSKLDYIGLDIKPDDPSLPEHTILFHLNVQVFVSPAAGTLSINTPGTTQNQLHLTATVPGDGYDPAGSQVTWQAFVAVPDTSGDPKKDANGAFVLALDAKSQPVTADSTFITVPDPTVTAETPATNTASARITAPSTPGAFVVRATSKVQPDKFVDVPVTVKTSSGLTFGFN